MSQDLALITLCLVFIATNGFWAYTCMSLNNRLMSRNYFEFTQGQKNLKATKPQTLQSDQVDVIDPEVERQAKDLNSLFGIA